MKKIGVTSICGNEAQLKAVGTALQRYGLQPFGGEWIPTLTGVRDVDWLPMADALLAQRIDLWLVLVDTVSLAKPGARYGLNLLTATLSSRLGGDLPLAVMRPDAASVESTSLPALLRNAVVLDPASNSWPAKLVALAHARRQGRLPFPDRLSVLGNEQFGQWFELSPAAGTWPGVIFGVSGNDATIDFQAVGKSGALPEKTVNAYAQQGLKINVSDHVFDAWAVRNPVGKSESGPTTSYFVRVRGTPQSLLWMPYTDDDAPSAPVVSLE